MRVLRQSGVLGRAAAWSAILATILHVALLSLHLTAAIERTLQAPGADATNLGIHAFCGPATPQSTLPVGLADGQTAPPENDGNSGPGCPICSGATPAFCAPSPVIALAPVVFSVASLPSYITSDKALAHQARSADTIRGPPLIV